MRNLSEKRYHHYSEHRWIITQQLRGVFDHRR